MNTRPEDSNMAKCKWPELEGLDLCEERKYEFNKFRFWRVVIAASVFYSFYYLGRLNWGICMPWIIQDLSISSTQAGVGASLLMWAYAVGTFLSGRFGEQLGQRLVCFWGGIGTTVMNCLVALQTSLTAIFVPWTINGFIQGQAYAPINGMICNWYPKAGRGIATGIFATSMGISTIIAWAVTGWSVVNYGWRWAFTWPLIFLTLPLTLIFYFVSRNKPEEAGFPAYKETTQGISTQAEALRDDQISGVKAWKYLLGNWKFLFLCLASFTAYVARYGLLTWIPLYYAKTAGISIKNVPLLTFGIPIGMAIGPVVGGWISDRFFGAKRWQVIVMYCLLSIAVLLTMAFIPIKTMGLTAGVILQILAGLLVLGMCGVLFTAACDFGGRKMAGTAVGTINFFNYLGAGIQGIIIGGILDSSGSWTLVWGLCAALLAFAAILASIARE